MSVAAPPAVLASGGSVTVRMPQTNNMAECVVSLMAC